MIKIENLSYRYSKRQILFNGMNLEMRPGKIYGLLGKNGAGKSTLMKSIAGLLFPFEGTCTVNNFSPQDRNKRFLEQLFFIPEECYLPSLSIPQFVDVYAPFYPSFSMERLNHYLSEFNIDKERHLSKLSFGQKKKAFISFGLATNTSIVIMDEPTNGLDIPSKVQFRNILTKASNENNIILLSTHQVRDLDDLISDVIIVDNSKLLLHEPKERIGKIIRFSSSHQIGNGEIYYEEQTPNGPVAMCSNKHSEASYVDLEVLFNATLSNPSLIASLFKQPMRTL
jgi:ABC-2 type transport system ATP-binding protein